MSNFLKKGLCSLLTAGFILSGCNSVNKQEVSLPKLTKSLTQPKITSYEQTIRFPMSGGKSNFYLIKDALLERNIFSSYGTLPFPKQEYLHENRQTETDSQIREEILKIFNLDRIIAPLNKIKFYKTPAFDAKIDFNFFDLNDFLNRSSREERERLWFLEEISFNVRYRF